MDFSEEQVWFSVFTQESDFLISATPVPWKRKSENLEVRRFSSASEGSEGCVDLREHIGVGIAGGHAEPDAADRDMNLGADLQ